MNTDKDRLNGITQQIIGCAFRVINTLGCGFLEKVYENALAYELRKAGLSVQQQYPIAVKYNGVVVGDYVADLVVEGTVLVELKAVKALDEIHQAQCINYLKATNLPVCLLINFGSTRLVVKRLAGPGAIEPDEED
jgi:GxxExxY protein